MWRKSQCCLWRRASRASIPGVFQGCSGTWQALLARQKRRKNQNERLIRTLEQDLERLENGVSLPAPDRYMALIAPEMTTALDYVPQDALVVVCDHSGLHRAAKRRMEELGLQLDSLLETGSVAGELCDFVCQWEEFCARLEGRPVAYLDAFAGAAYPMDRSPGTSWPSRPSSCRATAAIWRRQLRIWPIIRRWSFPPWFFAAPAAGRSCCRPCSRTGACLVFWPSPSGAMPRPGQILLAEGNLPSGMEYPTMSLAILTEGQLMARQTPKAKPAKSGSTNRMQQHCP